MTAFSLFNGRSPINSKLEVSRPCCDRDTILNVPKQKNKNQMKKKKKKICFDSEWPIALIGLFQKSCYCASRGNFN